MLKTTILSILLAATSLVATESIKKTSDATAIHTGKAEIFHDGDFVKFSLNFEASCRDTQINAQSAVNEDIASFSDSWLKPMILDQGTDQLSYTVDPLETWRKTSDYYPPVPAPMPTDGYYAPSYPRNPCEGKYYASQNLVIELKKPAAAEALSSEFIESFYNDLQLIIAHYGYDNTLYDSEPLSNITINSIRKGLYESTVDQMRRDAKAKAQEKATNDFLSFLGARYQGYWYLYQINFSDRSYGSLGSLEIGVDSAAAPMARIGAGNDNYVVPSVLKLKPMSIELSGEFVFRFKPQREYRP